MSNLAITSFAILGVLCLLGYISLLVKLDGINDFIDHKMEELNKELKELSNQGKNRIY